MGIKEGPKEPVKKKEEEKKEPKQAAKNKSEEKKEIPKQPAEKKDEEKKGNQKKREVKAEEKIKEPEKKAPVKAAPKVAPAKPEGDFIYVQCIKVGPKIRLRIANSTSYNNNWNCQGPRSIRREGVVYRIDNPKVKVC